MELAIVDQSPAVVSKFTISLRELHTQLGYMPKEYTKWTRTNILGTEKRPSIYAKDYDYIVNTSLASSEGPGNKTVDYLVTKQVAMDLALLSKNELGQNLRVKMIKQDTLEANNNINRVYELEAQIQQYVKMLQVAQESNRALALSVSNSNVKAVNLKDLFRVSRYKIGRNQLYNILRDKGIITKLNKPTSICIKGGYMIMEKQDTFVTRDGLLYITELLEDKEKQIIEAPTVEDIRNILATAASEIVFDEPTHKYTYKGVEFKSVSSVLKKYTGTFPANFMAGKVAAKRRREGDYFISADNVLKEWDLKRDIAANFGTLVHYKLEQYAAAKYLIGKVVKPVTIDKSLLNVDREITANLLVEQGKKWLDKMIESGYELVDTEVMMLNPTIGYSGTVDLLFLKDNKLVIADWKSNQKDITNDDYNNYMLSPLSSMKATTVNKYKIQLNLYKKLMRAIVPLEVEHLIIVHLKEDRVDTYRCEDLTEYL